MVGLTLIVTEVMGGRLSRKKFTGVGFAIVIAIAVFLSLLYAQYYGVYDGTFLDNFRKAKSFVFEPVLLYGLAFLLIDTREQGERYLLYFVIALGMLNFVSAVAVQYGFEVYRAYGIYDSEDEGKKRLAGFTGNPNKTAYLTCILIAFQYYFYKFHKSKIIKYLMAALMVGGLIVVLLTGSRGGLLMLAVVIIGLAYKLRDMKVIYAAVISIPLLVVVLLSTDSALLNNAIDRMATLTSSDSSEVTSGRNIIWSSLLSDFTNSFLGMLFGNGFGTAKYMGIRAEPHNIYLMVLVEFGIVGVSCFAYFIVAMFRRVSKFKSNGRDSLQASVLSSGYVVTFAWIFTTLIGALDLIWFTIGIAMATLYSENHKVETRKKNAVNGSFVKNKLIKH